MPKLWTVRLKQDISPREGLIKGRTFKVVTPQNVKNYPDLEKVLKSEGYNNFGGTMHDGFWEWT